MVANNNASSDLLALLNKGVEEATHGSKSRARIYFRQALSLDRDNENALLWLAWLTDDAYEAVEILEQVTVRNPKNEIAKAYLEQARAKRDELDQLVSSSNSLNIWNKPGAKKEIPSKQESVVPYIGEFLLRQGYITRQQLEAALKRHHDLAKRGHHKMVGQVLVELGYLTQTQLEAGLQQHRGEYYFRFQD
jgi:tetratricopeptide (TPR) repeat protein